MSILGEALLGLGLGAYAFGLGYWCGYRCGTSDELLRRTK